ncbi:unnamed protein product [Candida verbasci]|uniref:GPI-anchored protein n=1 Tax=Candida verbasci TaxID=1227364 RepID=A0A9W4TVT5_9ASCO|nr:unnamed protein product [Candida verbasci]
MHFTQIIISVVGVLTSIAYSLPATPVQQFEIIPQNVDFQSELDSFVESNFDEKEVNLYYELMDIFHQEDLSKRDEQTEQIIGNILLAVNQSGIIWDLLDAIADDPSRVEWLTNLTSNFFQGQNITISLDSLTSLGSSDSLLGALASQLNISAIIGAVENSGLVGSLLDGLLLDENFRPYLVNLIDKIVLSLKNVLLYIFSGLLAKRDLIPGNDLMEIFKRAETTQSINTAQLASLFAQATAEANSQQTTQQQAQSTQSINTAQLASLFAAASAEQAQSTQSINTAQLASLFAAASAEQASQTTTGTSLRSSQSASISSARTSASSVLDTLQSRASASSSIDESSRSSARANTSSSSLSGTIAASTTSNAYSGSLASFAANAGGAIVSSPVVGSIAEDFLNALNDTGFAVYFVKRFISTESYVNLTGDLIGAVINSGAFHLDLSGLNITDLVDEALSDPTAIVTFVGSLLTGDSSAITSTLAEYWGKYGSALQSILSDLEANGLFAELNQYIFGDGSTSVTPQSQATSTQQSTTTSNQNRDQLISTSTRSWITAQTSTASTQNKATNSGNSLKLYLYVPIMMGAALIFI